MNVNWKLLATAVVWAYCASCVLLAPARADAPLAVLEKHANATLQVVCCLRGADIGRLARGQAITVGELEEQRIAQIAQAVRLMYPKCDAAWGSPADWRLRTRVRFFVTFSHPALGKTGRLTIPLHRFFAALDPYSESERTVASAPDPPDLHSVLMAAPADQAGRVRYVTRQALDVLATMGAAVLGSEPGIPFAYGDFVSMRNVGLSDLTPEERTWVVHLYTDFSLRALELGSTQCSGDAGGFINGIGQEWLEKAPPLWSEIKGGTLRLSVEYALSIQPPKDRVVNAHGWVLNTIP